MADAVSVKDLRALAEAIADKAEESERLFADANARYGEYTKAQQELRSMAAEFNVLAQRISAAGASEPAS